MVEYDLINIGFYSGEFWKNIEENHVQIKEPKFRWENKYKYWISVIKPNGKMIIPSKDDIEIKGHPILADKNIYPNDNVLALLYDFFWLFKYKRTSQRQL